MLNEDVRSIALFLQVETSPAWLKQASAPQNLSLLLQDHLLCELKAAQSAVWVLRRHVLDSESGDRLLDWLKPYEQLSYHGTPAAFVKIQPPKDLLLLETQFNAAEIKDQLLLLTQEELTHFLQVLRLMENRGIKRRSISASRYARTLIQHVRAKPEQALLDRLIVGAFIEARSCERFSKLIPYLDADLAKFYSGLVRSEARHYEVYLNLARKISAEEVSARIEIFGAAEAAAISSSDPLLRFHSGIPQ